MKNFLKKLRYNKHVKFGKMATVNLSKHGASLTLGVPGLRISFGKNAIRKSVGIPGTGLSWVTTKKRRKRLKEQVLDEAKSVNSMSGYEKVLKMGGFPHSKLAGGKSSIVSSYHRPGFELTPYPDYKDPSHFMVAWRDYYRTETGNQRGHEMLKKISSHLSTRGVNHTYIHGEEDERKAHHILIPIKKVLKEAVDSICEVCHNSNAKKHSSGKILCQECIQNPAQQMVPTEASTEVATSLSGI